VVLQWGLAHGIGLDKCATDNQVTYLSNRRLYNNSNKQEDTIMVLTWESQELTARYNAQKKTL